MKLPLRVGPDAADHHRSAVLLQEQQPPFRPNRHRAERAGADGLTVKLGDAPIIVIPSVIPWNGSKFVWDMVRQTALSGWTEARQTGVSVNFVPGGEGDMWFRAQYACVPGSLDCPFGHLAPADAATCSLAVGFAAAPAP